MKAVLLVSILVCGCAHSAIVPFQREGRELTKTYPPTPPGKVGVYRVMHPYASFDELGLISYRASSYDLQELYGQIRTDAADYGAQAVIDVKITGETHVEYVSEEHCTPKTTCDANGVCTTDNNCHTEQVPKDVSTFLITGTMIRGKP